MTVASFSTPVYSWPDGSFRTAAPSTAMFILSAPFIHGNSVTINTGQLNFGTRSNQSPLIWDRFNGTPGELLSAYDSTWEPYLSHDGALIGDSALTARYSGGKYAYNTSSRHEFDTNSKTLSASRTRYLSYWYRTVDVEVSSTDEGVIKHCRLTSSTGIGGGGVYNGRGVHALSAAIPQGNGDPFVFFTNSANVVQDQLKVGGGAEYIPVPWNQWAKISMWLRMSDVGQANGHFGIKVLGGEFWERTDLMQNVAGQPELLSDSMILGLMQANAVGTYSQQITDVYLDDYKGRFEVGDAGTYDACTKLEDQPYTAWANDEVTVIANTIAIPGSKWLYYTDENHQTNGGSGIGYALS